MVGKHVLVSKENVLCNRQTGKCSDLLYDNCHTLMICLYLVGSCDLFSIQDKFTGVFLVNTGQTGGQCGFTGTIFTDQRVDLAFFKGKGNMIQGVCDSKMFVNFFCF